MNTNMFDNRQVQPDMEELAANMEDNENDKESTKEEVKLGRLQFKIDYDFNQANVSAHTYTVLYYYYYNYNNSSILYVINKFSCELYF